VVISGVVLLDAPLKIKDSSSIQLKTDFLYIPGFLSFREGPAAIKAVRGLKEKPTLLFVDGCGANHPRAAGLASYIDVIMDLPTVGISKGILCGTAEIPKNHRGEAHPLEYKGEQIGYLLKSAKGCNPLVIGPGHLVSMESSLDLARKFLVGQKYKPPGPVGLAHRYVNGIKRSLFLRTVRD
jgi:deoxyribonuclease V